MEPKSPTSEANQKASISPEETIRIETVISADNCDQRTAEKKLAAVTRELLRIKKELSQERREKERLQKELLNAEKHHCLMFNEMISGYALNEIICDSDGKPCDFRILDANPAFEKLTGLKVEKIVGKTIRQIMPNIEARWIEAFGKVALEGKPIRLENYNRDLDSYYDVTAYSNEFGKFTMIFNDISELKKAEKSVKQSSEKIKHFAYSVSHDLKNPALAVHNLARFLHEKYGHALDEKGGKCCEIILKSSEDIVALLDRVNTFIATKELPLSIEKIDLKEVFDNMKDEFRSQLAARNVQLTTPQKLPVVHADRASVVRIIRNLVDNALKYGGPALREIAVWHKENEQFHILCVKDDGVGMTNKDHEALFTPFNRLKNSEGVKGTGLGLSIVKEIAEQHLGKVWVEENQDAGATFCVSISKELMPAP